MSIVVLTEQMLMIFIMTLTGWFLARKNIITTGSGKDFSALVVNVCNPALILMSVLDSESGIGADELADAFILGFIIYVILILMGLLVPRIIRAPEKDHYCYNMMMLFSNIGFIGIPIVSAVLGVEAVIYLVVFNIYFVLIIYTYGILLISQGNGEKQKFHFGDMINVGTVSSILAIVLCVTGVKLPEVLSETIHYMGRSTTFLSMVVIGISLSQMNLRKTFSDLRMYAFVFVRQLLFPVVIGILAKPFVHDPLMFGTMLIVLALPAGNMPLMMAEEAGKDTDLFSRGIVVSTVLSIVTLPLVVLFVG